MKFSELYVALGFRDERFRKGIKGAQKQTSILAKSMKSLGAMIAGTFAVQAMFNFMRGLYKVNVEFERTMSSVRAITNATDKEFNKLSKSARELGRVTTKTASEVAGLQKEFALIGFSTKEIIDATSATISLAEGTGEDLVDSARVAGATLRGFGIAATETQRVVDLMAASFTSSALNLERWGESMKYVAPIAKKAGITIEETAAMLSVLADAGIHGSMAGTGMRKIISELDDAGKPLIERLRELAKQGISLADANDEVGERAKTALLVLVDQTNAIKENTVAYNDNKDAAKTMADISTNNIEGAVARMNSAFVEQQLGMQSVNKVWKDWIDSLTWVATNGKDIARKILNISLSGFQAGRAFKGFGDLLVPEDIDNIEQVAAMTAEEAVALAGATTARLYYLEAYKKAGNASAAERKRLADNIKIVDEIIRQSKEETEDIEIKLSVLAKLAAERAELVKLQKAEMDPSRIKYWQDEIQLIDDKVLKLKGLNKEIAAEIKLIKDLKLEQESQLKALASEREPNYTDWAGVVEEPLEGRNNEPEEDFEYISGEALEKLMVQLDAVMEKEKEVAATSQALQGVMFDMSSQIVKSLDLAATGMEGFISNLVDTIIKLIAMLLAQSIAQSVANAGQSASATGQAAVITQPIFMATLIGGVLSAFAAIPSFESGGIIPGHSFTGDNMLIRANSGELVLNGGQQRNLFDMLNTGGYGGYPKEVVLRARGTDLIGVIHNENRHRNN